MPRHFLRENGADGKVLNRGTTLNNGHHNNINATRNGGGHLPTVSASLYDHHNGVSGGVGANNGSRHNNNHHGTMMASYNNGSNNANGTNSRYQPLRTPYYTTLGRQTNLSNNAMLKPSTLVNPSQQLLQQQQEPKQFDSYYYHPATLMRPGEMSTSSSNGTTGTSHSTSSTGSSGNGGGGLTRPLLPNNHHPQQQQSGHRVVYADLALEEPPGPGPRSGSAADYAVLKFNASKQIGKEIDV